MKFEIIDKLTNASHMSLQSQPSLSANYFEKSSFYILRCCDIIKSKQLSKFWQEKNSVACRPPVMLHMQKAAFAIFLLSLLSSSSGEPPTLTDEDWGDSIESIDVEGEQKLKMASRGPRYASSNFPEPVKWGDHDCYGTNLLNLLRRE